MRKKILITQSNYIPWKGYFDGINLCDEFVVYDDMQFTKRDWRNRNMIKTASGPKWLTIPVEVKGKFFQKINETKIADHSWARSHLDQIKQSYKGAAFFSSHIGMIAELYEKAEKLQYLTDVNLLFLDGIGNFLGIKTPHRMSSEFKLNEERTMRLVDICVALNGTDYYSGPAAKAYMDESMFRDKGIAVHYFDYSGYQQYPQLHGEFTHAVSIVDLILNVGDESKNYLKSFNGK